MWLGTESWDKIGEVRGTGSPRWQSWLAGAEQLSLLEAERGHSEMVLMVLDGSCGGDAGISGDRHTGDRHQGRQYAAHLDERVLRS